MKSLVVKGLRETFKQFLTAFPEERTLDDASPEDIKRFFGVER